MSTIKPNQSQGITAGAAVRPDLAAVPEVRQAVPINKGINRRFFFDTVRIMLFDGKVTPSQLGGLEAILNRWEAQHAAADDRWLAYMLATAHHETDRKMVPIDEYGKGKGMAYGKRVKHSGAKYTDTLALFYGRGLVQITWYENYERAGLEICGNRRAFLDAPEEIKEPQYATAVLFLGMTEGWFTGKKLETYFNAKTEDWINARRIINGLDRAELIASYAKKYYAAISYTSA